MEALMVLRGSTYPIVENGLIVGAANVAQLLYLQNLKTSEYIKQKLYVTDDIITQNKKMEEIKALILEVSNSDSPVMIYGETGTGKEMIAESIHSEGKRRAKNFIAQNCAAIPPHLLESMFFGTEKGGFTGAESREGLFEMASGGTLFLDEINSLDLGMQAKLLKAIEEQKVRRIGGSKDIPFNVRLICATNEPLEKLLREKRIREDLYYRICVLQIEIPPLRQRPEDILLLAEHFIAYYNEKMNRSIKGISSLTEQVFVQWDWPGNVRELKNIIESAFNLEKKAQISLESVNPLFRRMQLVKTISDEQKVKIPEHKPAPLGIQKIEPGSQHSLEDMLKAYEKEIIEMIMEQEEKLSDVAARLDISPQKLQYRLKKLGISHKKF
ncbi:MULTISPECIES: sigma-54 interaction domain-containing protein [Clostridia]|nr:sigma 54-interacting transcriptional regulator [Senimuribacter intestinalis]